MKLRCQLFGHKKSKGAWGNDTPYFKKSNWCVDGIGVVHVWLEDECERCGEKYTIGMVHLPNGALKSIEEQRRLTDGWKSKEI